MARDCWEIETDGMPGGEPALEEREQWGRPGRPWRARPDEKAARIRALERELRRKDRALAEARALLELLEQMLPLPRGGRGRLHGPEKRRRLCALVGEAQAGGARQALACRLVGVSARTIQRWGKPWLAEDRRAGGRHPPANRLSEDERGRVLEVLRSTEHRGLSPKQLVPRLADRGMYLASESTIYRLLRAERQTARPRRVRPVKRAPEWVAAGPNQLWSWDITYLRGPVRGAFLYLYLVMDVFSRRVMGWSVHGEETAERAAQLILRSCQEHGVRSGGLVLHSDNGGPMKGATMLSTLRRLGIVPSFSRPRVCDDNPFSEALFRTLKDRPGYPRGAFDSLDEARAWVARFACWYNGEHLHSGLGFVTPDDWYFGRAPSILARRREVYECARALTPARWSGHPRRWLHPGRQPA